MNRWLTILLCIAAAACAVGVWKHAVSAYRHLSWATVSAEIMGEGVPVQVRVGKAHVAKLRIDYQFETNGLRYGGSGVVQQIPGDRKVAVRHSPTDPKQNAISLGPARWATELAVGGGLLLVFLQAIRSGLKSGSSATTRADRKSTNQET